jgi:quaternary ammonium compound-resistance protein SugE
MRPRPDGYTLLSLYFIIYSTKGFILAWFYLALAAAFEIVFAVSMKQSHGFTRLWPSVLTVVGVIGGITLLTIALKSLPVSVAYPIWVGVGTLGTVLFGVLVLNEGMTPIKLASVAVIILGVAGLKLSTPSSNEDSTSEPGPTFVESAKLGG